MSVRLDEILKGRGMRFADLARQIGVDKATVTRWAQKGIPAERVPDIERLTGISRHQLRPDLWSEPELVQQEADRIVAEHAGQLARR